MRIREVFLKNIRNFRDERLISFVDPLTGDVRPLTVLGGSNGSGKTTVLQAIESLLAFPVSRVPDELIVEAILNGYIGLHVELSEEEYKTATDKSQFPSDLTFRIEVGNQEQIPLSWLDKRQRSVRELGLSPYVFENGVVVREETILTVLSKASDLSGGYLIFPHDRYLGKTKQSRIEEPTKQPDWLFHYKADDSLEQLWVWQNYLDLEQGAAGKNLTPFIQRIEKVLGNNRRIFIQDGKVYVHTGWKNADGSPGKVRLDQLPSGEQQVLLLLGEIQRRMRKGAVIAIDEVENSLHPTLQRLLMWNLRQIAREWDAQVIVTTHSPEIIRTVRGGAFINLDYPEDRFDRSLDEEGEEAR